MDPKQVQHRGPPPHGPDQTATKGIDGGHDDPALRCSWDISRPSCEYAELSLSQPGRRLNKRSRTMIHMSMDEGTRPEDGESTLHGAVFCRLSPNCTRDRSSCRRWTRWACAEKDCPARPPELEDTDREAQMLRHSREAL